MLNQKSYRLMRMPVKMGKWIKMTIDEKYSILTVFPFKSFTRQCKYTLFPKCVVTLTLPFVSSKYGNGSWVVVSSPSSISFSSGVSVNGDENSCQKFFGNESNGSPSRGFTTATAHKHTKWTRTDTGKKRMVSTFEIFNEKRRKNKTKKNNGQNQKQNEADKM